MSVVPNHPLAWFPVEHEKTLLIMLVIATALVTIGIGVADAHLRTDVTPMGIASFEFVQNAENANRAIAAWGETGRAYAALSFGLD